MNYYFSKDLKILEEVEGKWTLMIGYQSEAITEEIILSWEHDDFVWKSVEETTEMDFPNFFRELIDNVKLP